MNDNLDDPLYKNIYPSMQEKETDELLRIWKENDREQWSEAAFAVVHDILLERTGQVPEQEPSEKEEEIKYYHNPETLLNIALWANILSWIILIVFILIVVAQLLSGGYDLYILVFNSLHFLLTGFFYFLVLQATAKGIPVLLDIVDNTEQVIEASHSQE